MTVRAATAALLTFLLLAVPAVAQEPVRPKSLDEPPQFHRMTGNQVLRIADRNAKVVAERAKFPGSTHEVFTKGATRWQVSYYSKGRKKEIAQVLVDDASGAVLEAWTGFRVPWTMARGYPGAFGRKVTAPYVWIPLLIAFVVPFVDVRRPLRLLHLDLLVLASMSISLALFVNGEIEWSVPLSAPPLVYVLGRMLWIGLRPRARLPAAMPKLLVPYRWLAVGLVFLLSFRIGLNITNSNVIDVGFSGVLGADRIMDGDPLYGGWPKVNEHGDTYGPLTYLLYIPFEQLVPWSGDWDDLPAAHAAAIVFDLLTVLMMFLLGRRVAGAKLGIALAYAWAAFPFTLFALNCNANDALVSFLVCLALYVAVPRRDRPGWSLVRGGVTAAAGLAKFAPLALTPLLALHDGVRPRRLALFAAGFAAVAAALLLPFVSDVSLFYDRTIGFQADRNAPFSLWGLYDLDRGSLYMSALAVMLACGLPFVPRRTDLAGLAALCAAVLVAVQLSLTYWFYLYVVWFFPLVMLALLAPAPASTAAAPPRSTPPAAEPRPEPALP